MTSLLIVDDSVHDLELVQESLADIGTGWTIWVATDGPEGILLAHQHDPDLVLLDLNMPRMHGFEVLDRLRATHPCLPVVVCSTSNSQDDLIGSVQRGARAYLAKPSDYHSLVDQLRRTMAFWAIAR